VLAKLSWRQKTMGTGATVLCLNSVSSRSPRRTNMCNNLHSHTHMLHSLFMVPVLLSWYLRVSHQHTGLTYQDPWLSSPCPQVWFLLCVRSSHNPLYSYWECPMSGSQLQLPYCVQKNRTEPSHPAALLIHSPSHWHTSLLPREHVSVQW